jgi:hypothetical protein
MTHRSVTLGFSIGDEEACAGNDSPPITVGHDLVVTGNTAVPGGYLEVSDNRVGHDAICARGVRNLVWRAQRVGDAG